MHKLTHKIKELGGRRIVFSLVVLAYLGFLAVINALMFLPILGLLPDNTLSAMGHFGDFLGTGDTHNLIHFELRKATSPLFHRRGKITHLR